MVGDFYSPRERDYCRMIPIRRMDKSLAENFG